MMKKRVTTDDDFERIAENMKHAGYDKNIVKDEESFNRAYDKYMGATNSSGDDAMKDSFRKKVFKSYRLLDVFEKSGGKNLAKDRNKTAKKVTKSIKIYEKEGANRIDFAGFDTKSRTKSPVLKVKMVYIMVRGKKTRRFRDALGRWAKKPTAKR